MTVGKALPSPTTSSTAGRGRSPRRSASTWLWDVDSQVFSAQRQGFRDKTLPPFFFAYTLSTSNKLPRGFWVVTLFQNLQHLEKNVARVIYLENLFDRCTLWCFRQWHSQDTSRTSALIGLTPWLLRCEPRFSPNIPPANHLRKDSGGFWGLSKPKGSSSKVHEIWQ